MKNGILVHHNQVPGIMVRIVLYVIKEKLLGNQWNFELSSAFHGLSQTA